MSEVALLFLLAPLVVVPLGMRLLEVVSPESRPPTLALASVLPAGILLAIAFRFAPGSAAATLAVPWVVLTGVVAASAAVHRLIGPHPWRPDAGMAIVAATLFLATGAAFALTDRLGARPFGFESQTILLTAVHFHFAGFALPVAGAIAWTRRPIRWLGAALGAVVVGIPITALGFLGIPGANWIGAVLTAVGGFGIGLVTIRVASMLARRSATILAGIAGVSLLVSMPLALAYGTEVQIGATWLSVERMAAVHGTLNAVGFALAAMVAWTLDRLARAAERQGPLALERRRPPTRRWVEGLIVGLVVGVGILVAGPLVGAIGIVATLLLSFEPGRDAPVGGLLIGFGIGWLAIFGSSSARCGQGCVQPDLGPWIGTAFVTLAVGAILTWRATRHLAPVLEV
jgi:YndJ-like protein